MCASKVDIQSPTAEIRREKKKGEKKRKARKKERKKKPQSKIIAIFTFTLQGS